MRFALFLLLNFLVFPGMLSAQNDSLPEVREINYDQGQVLPVEFDEAQLEAYKRDTDFNYEKIEEENWWTRFKKWVGKIWNQFWHWLLGGREVNGFFAFLIRILPYLIVAGVLGFVIWLFIKLNPAAGTLKATQKASVNLSEEEKIIAREDIGALIKKAVKEKNYRLAVRYYYLLLLKKLRDLELINYQSQKTNEEYSGEIKQLALKEQFQKITHLYDFIWYGDFPVSELDFKKAETEFDKIQTLVNSKTRGPNV